MATENKWKQGDHCVYVTIVTVIRKTKTANVMRKLL